MAQAAWPPAPSCCAGRGCGAGAQPCRDLLALGAEPATAWTNLTGLADNNVDALFRLARRSASSGAALAQGVTELADQSRHEAWLAASAAAERASVLIAGPLGLCFLPAFVCWGIVPVVAGLAGDCWVSVIDNGVEGPVIGGRNEIRVLWARLAFLAVDDDGPATVSILDRIDLQPMTRALIVVQAVQHHGRYYLTRRAAGNLPRSVDTNGYEVIARGRRP